MNLICVKRKVKKGNLNKQFQACIHTTLFLTYILPEVTIDPCYFEIMISSDR